MKAYEMLVNQANNNDPSLTTTRIKILEKKVEDLQETLDLFNKHFSERCMQNSSGVNKNSKEIEQVKEKLQKNFTLLQKMLKEMKK